MSRKRLYDDGCATAHALDLVGERWGLLVVRELLFGPRRFTDLEAGMPGASTNALSLRLRELEAAGVLRRRKLSPPAASWVYELTDWGRDLEPIVIGLGRWGARSPQLSRREHTSLASLMLALKALFDPPAAGKLQADVTVRINGESFRLRIDDGRIELSRGESDAPDAVVTATMAALESALWWPDTDAAAKLAIDGDDALVARLFTLFPVPSTVGSAEERPGSNLPHAATSSTP